MHISFSYLIIGAICSKHNGDTNHNKQLIPAAELNNKTITHTTRVLFLQAPGQLMPTFLLYWSILKQTQFIVFTVGVLLIKTKKMNVSDINQIKYREQ